MVLMLDAALESDIAAKAFAAEMCAKDKARPRRASTKRAGDGRRVRGSPNSRAATASARVRFRGCDDEAPEWRMIPFGLLPQAKKGFDVTAATNLWKTVWLSGC